MGVESLRAGGAGGGVSGLLLGVFLVGGGDIGRCSVLCIFLGAVGGGTAAGLFLGSDGDVDAGRESTVRACLVVEGDIDSGRGSVGVLGIFLGAVGGGTGDTFGGPLSTTTPTFRGAVGGGTDACALLLAFASRAAAANSPEPGGDTDATLRGATGGS